MYHQVYGVTLAVSILEQEAVVDIPPHNPEYVLLDTGERKPEELEVVEELSSMRDEQTEYDEGEERPREVEDQMVDEELEEPVPGEENIVRLLMTLEGLV